MQKLLLVIMATVLLWVSIGRADDRCDRGITYRTLQVSNLLSADEKARLNRGELISKFVRQGNGYEIGYVFSVTGHDPELVMGTFASVEEHAGRLGKFIERSEIRNGAPGSVPNPMLVFYRQSGKLWFKDSEYTLENTLQARADQDGRRFYSFDSRLVSSNNEDFSPRFVDAYFRVFPLGSGTFVAACNYMVPRSGSWRSQYNDIAQERFSETGSNFARWVDSIASNSEVAAAKRQRVTDLLNAAHGVR